MIHQGSDSSAADEWYCPECGRHFIVRWDPAFDQLVLAPGDSTVSHGGSQHGTVEASAPRIISALAADNPHLKPSPEWQ